MFVGMEQRITQSVLCLVLVTMNLLSKMKTNRGGTTVHLILTLQVATLCAMCFMTRLHGINS